MSRWSDKRDANGDRTHDGLGQPLDETGKKFFRLRESGYTGWIDQDSNKAPCPKCHTMTCAAGLTERCNS